MCKIISHYFSPTKHKLLLVVEDEVALLLNVFHN